MGRRGGLRGAAAESAAIRGQAGGAAERHRRARADRLRRRGRLRILDQGAAPARARAQPAQPAARRAYGRARVGAAGAAGRRAGLQRRARRHAGRPAGQRPSHPGQRRGRLFPYGRHHRRAQAGHPHARQPGLHRLGRGAAAKRRPRRCGHQRLSAVPRGRRPARLAGRAVGRRRHHHPHDAAAAQPRGAAQLLAPGRAPSRHLAAGRADHPGGAGRGAAGRRGHFLAALLPHWRRAAAGRTGRALRAAIRPARQRKPGHDRNGRHLVHQPTWLGFSGQLRGLSAALCTGAHRHAGRRPGRPARDLPPGEAGMVLFKAPT